MIFYQFPISHYCEKARWALDYKGLNYDVKNLVPGFHFLQAKRIAEKSSVPILVDDLRVVQGSSEIISYLDEVYPSRMLTPAGDQLSEEVCEWEQFLDKEIGDNLRRIFYFEMLEDKQRIKASLLKGSQWYLRPLFHVMFPVLKRVMKKSMQIYPRQTKQSETRLVMAFDRLEKVLAEQPFIVGDQFSRVDLTASALLAPLFRPPESCYYSTDPFPGSLEPFAERMKIRPISNWVNGIYKKYRQ